MTFQIFFNGKCGVVSMSLIVTHATYKVIMRTLILETDNSQSIPRMSWTLNVLQDCIDLHIKYLLINMTPIMTYIKLCRQYICEK